MERIENNKLSYMLIITSCLFLGFIASIFVGSCILFVFKISITKANFIVFPIIAMVIAKFVLDKDGERLEWNFFIICLVAFFVLVGVLAIINNFIWDSSYDSLAYHQDAIVKLYEGWNPFYQYKENINIWVMHYTKAAPVFAAALYKLTGRIESAKVLTSLMPIILFMLSFGVFNLIGKNKKKLSCFAAIMLACNPVILYQMFSYYVDSLVGVYVIILIINLFLILFYRDLFFFKYFTLINVAVFLINIKFTGLAYAMVILFGFLIINFIYNKRTYNIRLIGFLIAGFIFSVIIVGFNPYVTNYVTNGHPLYPLAGENKIDIMTTNTPEDFRYDNSFKQAVKAIVAVPSNANYKGEAPKNLLDVFKIDQNVLGYYSGTDARVRGFGVYSLMFFPISFIGLIYLLVRSNNRKIKVSSIITLVAVGFAMIYGGDFWWARYVPYLWGIPVLVAFLFILDNNKNMKRAGKGLFAIMIINCLLIGVIAVSGKMLRSNQMKEYIFSQELNIKADNFSNSFINKAKEYNLKYNIKE